MIAPKLKRPEPTVSLLLDNEPREAIVEGDVKRVGVLPEMEMPQPVLAETEAFEEGGSPKITLALLFSYSYSIAVSLSFVALCASCIFLLNHLEKYASTYEGSVMPSGVKLWTYVLWTMGIHSGLVVVAKFVDWTSSNGESYYYENPLLIKSHDDLQTDLKNPNDAGARLRIRWHSRRFYTFYFVSVGICLLMLTLNKLIGLS